MKAKFLTQSGMPLRNADRISATKKRKFRICDLEITYSVRFHLPNQVGPHLQHQKGKGLRMTPNLEGNSEVTTGGGGASGKGGLFVQRYFLITRFYFHRKTKYYQTLISFKISNIIESLYAPLFSYIT